MGFASPSLRDHQVVTPCSNALLGAAGEISTSRTDKLYEDLLHLIRLCSRRGNHPYYDCTKRDNSGLPLLRHPESVAPRSPVVATCDEHSDARSQPRRGKCLFALSTVIAFSWRGLIRHHAESGIAELQTMCRRRLELCVFRLDSKFLHWECLLQREPVLGAD